MKNFLLVLNKAVLFACVSMFFGTGLSLILFSFPIAPYLTPSNYYYEFVPEVSGAVHFFTYMTILIMVCCIIFIIEKFKSPLKWYPIITLVLTIATTALTLIYIIPYNDLMEAGFKTNADLHAVLTKWMDLNYIRVSIWIGMWLSMMVYYTYLAIQSYKYPQS
jgi:hypothetical protein